MGWTDEFIAGLHSSTTVLSVGKATVAGETFDAVQVRNLYDQIVVWGPFERRWNRKTKRVEFTGKRANDCNTEEVTYEATSRK